MHSPLRKTRLLNVSVEKMQAACAEMNMYSSLVKYEVSVPARASSIHHYREKELETEVVCERCSLRYAIYGVFACA